MDDLRSRLKRVMASLEERERVRGPVGRSLSLPWQEDGYGSNGGLWKPGEPGGGFEELGGRRGALGAGGLEELSGGREVETPHGKLFEIAQSFRGGYRHGRYRLDEFVSTDLGVLDLFCRGSGDLCAQPEDFLFLDLETTGLSLGVGTYAFLVGLGFFRDGKYHLRQFLLRSFPEETCMIANLKDWLHGFGVLVTFNGKRFDLPVLETRFSMCGMTLEAGRRPHWDLMYSSRRLWRGRIENCRLSTLEKSHLGVERGLVDIPGSMIPEVYYRYVHEGETGDLERVVYHNAMDVLSLTTLAIHTGRCLRERDPGGVNLLSMGGFFERMGMVGVGRECYEIAAGYASSRSEREEALFRLAMRMKRDGRRVEAVGPLEEIVRMGGKRVTESCEESAKVCEHDLRDFDRAIGFVRLALKDAEALDGKRRERLLRRLGRLERKRGGG